MHLPSSQSRATNANIQVLTARSPQGFSPTSRPSHLSDVSDGLSLTQEIGTEALYLTTVVITTVGDSLADQGKGKAGLSEPLLPQPTPRACASTLPIQFSQTGWERSVDRPPEWESPLLRGCDYFHEQLKEPQKIWKRPRGWTPLDQADRSRTPWSCPSRRSWWKSMKSLRTKKSSFRGRRGHQRVQAGGAWAIRCWQPEKGSHARWWMEPGYARRDVGHHREGVSPKVTWWGSSGA